MNKFAQFFKPKVSPPPLVHQLSWHRIAREAMVDWFFISLVSVACIASLIIINTSLYIDVDSTLSHKFVPDSFQQRPFINQKELTNTMSKIDQRAGVRTSILGGGQVGKLVIPSDPSL